MSQFNPLTQIKHQVQNKRTKKYQQIKQKSTTKYYELYLNKIIFIQKFWRKHLVARTIKLQKLSNLVIDTFNDNKQKNQYLKNKLQALKKRKRQLQNIDPNQNAQNYQQQLKNQMKLSLRNVFQGADQYAKIKAVLKGQMMSYKAIETENQNMRKSFQKNFFEVQSLKVNNRTLSQKIKQIHIKISNQKTQIMALKLKNSQVQSILSSQRSQRLESLSLK